MGPAHSLMATASESKGSRGQRFCSLWPAQSMVELCEYTVPASLQSSPTSHYPTISKESFLPWKVALKAENSGNSVDRCWLLTQFCCPPLWKDEPLHIILPTEQPLFPFRLQRNAQSWSQMVHQTHLAFWSQQTPSGSCWQSAPGMCRDSNCSALFSAASMGVRWMIGVTEIDKGSAYGNIDNKRKQTD